MMKTAALPWNTIVTGAFGGAICFATLWCFYLVFDFWMFDRSVSVVYSASDLIGGAAVIAAFMGIAVSSRMLSKQTEIMRLQADSVDRQLILDEIREIEKAIAACQADGMAAIASCVLHNKLNAFFDEKADFVRMKKVFSKTYMACYEFKYGTQSGYKRFEDAKYAEKYSEFLEKFENYFLGYATSFADDPEDIDRFIKHDMIFDIKNFSKFVSDSKLKNNLDETNFVIFEGGIFFETSEYSSYKDIAVEFRALTASRIADLRKEVATLHSRQHAR